ncbi:MAG: helix-turn-helix transcriptional regulator [Oscillospiraceae bacterium]|jgi:transcriptional regulator with XRE-family HTH domain|nr:helix-turn-helix transcriptional regulator [Oscillospiraceae bacterium]
MKNFSEHLKNIRITKGLTQRQVAVGIDVGERLYQRYEAGKGKPSFENLWALADFFDISVDELMARDWKPKCT